MSKEQGAAETRTIQGVEVVFLRSEEATALEAIEMFVTLNWGTAGYPMETESPHDGEKRNG